MKIISVKILNLKDLNNQQFDQIHNIERKNFEEYYAQDPEDIEDDTEQEGFIGFGIEDKGELQGYVYGYEFITEDNIYDFNFNEMICYNNECKNEDFIENITELSDEGKILYVSNLAVNTDYRQSLNKILYEFIQKVKVSKYEYLAFEALSDSYNLMFKGNKVNKERLNRFGVELICVIDSGEQKCVLMKILK